MASSATTSSAATASALSANAQRRLLAGRAQTVSFAQTSVNAEDVLSAQRMSRPAVQRTASLPSVLNTSRPVQVRGDIHAELMSIRQIQEECAKTSLTPDELKKLKTDVEKISKKHIEDKMKSNLDVIRNQTEKEADEKKKEERKLQELQLKIKTKESSRDFSCHGVKPLVMDRATSSVSNSDSFKLQARQDLAFHRFVQFSNKKGMLFMHSVGTGKTVTSLSIALNSFLWNTDETTVKTGENSETETSETATEKIKKRKIVVVLPGSIFRNFEEELKEKIPNIDTTIWNKLVYDDTTKKYFSNYELSVTPIARIQTKFNNKNVTMIGYKYSEIAKALGDSNRVGGVQNIFKNAVVIFDEAHRLFRSYRDKDGSLQQMLDTFANNNFLKDSKRFLLMTGTPYNIEIGDTLKLLQMVDSANTGKALGESKYNLDNYPVQLLRELGYSENPKQAKEQKEHSMTRSITAYFSFLCSNLDIMPRKKIIEKYPVYGNINRKGHEKLFYEKLYRNMRQLKVENPDLEFRFWTETFLPSFSNAKLLWDKGYIGANSQEQKKKVYLDDRKYAERALIEWIADRPEEEAKKFFRAFPGLLIRVVPIVGKPVAYVLEKTVDVAGYALVGTHIVAKGVSTAYIMKCLYIFFTRIILGMTFNLAKSAVKYVIPSEWLEYLGILNLYQGLQSVYAQVTGLWSETTSPLYDWIATHAESLLSKVHIYLPAVVSNLRWLFTETFSDNVNWTLVIASITILVVNRKKIKTMFAFLLDQFKDSRFMRAWFNDKVNKIINAKNEEECAKVALTGNFDEESIKRAKEIANASEANMNRKVNNIGRVLGTSTGRGGASQFGGLRVTQESYDEALHTLGLSENTTIEDIGKKIENVQRELEASTLSSENSDKINRAIAILKAEKDNELEIINRKTDDDIDYSGFLCNLQYDMIANFKDMDLIRKFVKIAKELTFSEEFEAFNRIDNNNPYEKLLTVENYSAISGPLLDEIKKVISSIPDDEVNKFIKEKKEFMRNATPLSKSIVEEVFINELEKISNDKIIKNLPKRYNKNNNHTNFENTNTREQKGGTIPLEESNLAYESNSYESLDTSEEDDDDTKDISSLSEQDLDELSKSLDGFFDNEIVAQLEAEEKGEEAKKAGKSEEYVADLIATSFVQNGTLTQEEAIDEIKELNIQTNTNTLEESMKGGGVGDWVCGVAGALGIVGEGGIIRNIALGLVEQNQRIRWGVAATDTYNALQNYQNLLDQKAFNYKTFAKDSKALISNFNIEMLDIDSKYDGTKIKDNGLYFTIPSYSDMRFKDIANFFNVQMTSAGKQMMMPIDDKFKGINYEKESYRYPLREVKFIYIPYTIKQQEFGAEVYYQEKVSTLRWWNNPEIGEKLRKGPQETDPRYTLPRCIGNFSPECNEYRPVFPVQNALPQFYPDYILKQKDGKTDITEEQKNKLNEMKEGTRTSLGKMPFSCPKFDKILEHLILMKTGVMLTNFGLEAQPHLCRKGAEYFNEAGLKLDFGEGDYDLENYPKFIEPIKLTDDELNSLPNQRDTNGNIIKDAKGNPIKKVSDIEKKRLEVATHYFLPIVYSTSDIFGLNLFASYLKEQGFNYIVLHDNYSLSMSEREQERALKKVYKLINGKDGKRDKIIERLTTLATGKIIDITTRKERILTKEDYKEAMDYFKAIIDDKSEPICILLHPDITEGIDAKHNPAIFLMEPPNTYNDYEQLCGRILRTYQKGYDRRPKKMVYQMACFNIDSLKKMKAESEAIVERTEASLLAGQSFYLDEAGALSSDVTEGLDRYKLELQDYFPIDKASTAKDRFARALLNKMGFRKSLQKATFTSRERELIRKEFQSKFKKQHFTTTLKVLKALGRLSPDMERELELLTEPEDLGFEKGGIFSSFVSMFNPMTYLNAETYFSGEEDVKIAEANLNQYAIFRSLRRYVDNLENLGVTEDITLSGNKKEASPYEVFKRELNTSRSIIQAKESGGAYNPQQYEKAMKFINDSKDYYKEFVHLRMTSESPDISKIKELFANEYKIKSFLNIIGEDINPDLNEIYNEGTNIPPDIIWCQPFATHYKENETIICRPVSIIKKVSVNDTLDSSVFSNTSGVLSMDALAQAYKYIINYVTKKQPGIQQYKQFKNCDLTKMDDVRKLFLMKMKAKTKIEYTTDKSKVQVEENGEEEPAGRGLLKQCMIESPGGITTLQTIPDTYYQDIFNRTFKGVTVNVSSRGGKRVYKTRKQEQSKKRKTRRHR